MKFNVSISISNHMAVMVIALALAIGTSAHGQTTSPVSNVLEEIVVTAQKRTENLQTVPISVSAVSSATIDALHIHDLADLTGSIPNAQIQVNAGLTNAVSYVIRGIGIVANPSSYVGTEVATVIDGVVMTSNELGLIDQFDIDRIEVLRGPQGTLFGANTTGGVVNIITRQPTGEFDMYGQAGFGNYNSKNIALAVDFPIVANVLAGKIEAANRSRDGLYTNLYNDERIGGINSTDVRGYLKFTPTEAFDATLKVEDEIARNGTDVLLNISHPGEVFYTPTTPFGFELYSDVPDQHNSESKSVTLTMDWNTAAGKFTSISNYLHWMTRGYQDIPGIKVTNGYDQIGDTKGWQMSEELRDVIHPTENTEWLIGGFAQKWHYDSDGEGWLAFVQPGLIDDTLAAQDTTNLALFTQLYWNATDRLRFQIGARMSNEKVSMARNDIFSFNPAGTNPFLGFGNLVGAITSPVNPENPAVSGSHTWTNFGDKAGFDYKFTDSVMGYGYYSRGFKSGGYNGRISVATDFGPFNPEFVDSFETGLKSELFDHRVRLNLAAFLNKWHNMQVDQVFFSGNPPTAHSAIINAAKATTDGVEVEAKLLLAEGLQLDATAGYLHAQYDTFDVGSGPTCPPPPAAQPVPCTTGYGGMDLPYAPKFNGSLMMTYTTAVGAGEGVAMLQYTYDGARWGNFTEASTERLAADGLVNANLSWSPTGKKWTVSAWARNLLDKKYLTLALDAPPIFTEGLLGNPREFGLDVKFKL
jgi:iron complex outermembrane receptor protein